MTKAAAAKDWRFGAQLVLLAAGSLLVATLFATAGSAQDGRHGYSQSAHQ